MKPCYRLFVCPSCGEQHQYAGFCDSCSERPRLVTITAIPIQKIREAAEATKEVSSPIPAHFVEQFVESLIASCG